MKKQFGANFSGKVDNSLSIYLKEINKIPLLTREEEVEIARQAALGDKTAKDRLIAANLRFVVNVAKKYQNQGIALSDLISEGNIGLINAVKRFDSDKGYHFISYAVWWIRQAILKAICEKSRSIRLPLNRANTLVQIAKIHKESLAEKGTEPGDVELAERLGISAEIVRELLNISRDMISLDVPVYSDKDNSILSNLLEDQTHDAPEDVMIKNSLKDDLNTTLSTLTEKESQILQYRFGLNNKKPMSLKELGKQLNLTKERIRQIEKKALQKLQAPLQEKELDEYLIAH